MPAILMRNIPASVHARITQARQIRGLSFDEYFEKLLELHEAMRALADSGDERIQAELTRLGLQTISA